jgi:hypothetical protein
MPAPAAGSRIARRGLFVRIPMEASEREQPELRTDPLPIGRINESFTAALGNGSQAGNTVETVSALAIDLRRTTGYIVADRQGRLVGKVECPMYGTAPDVPDALSVKSGLFSRRRRLVPADTIDQIDGTSGVIGLRVDRENIRSFL